MCQQRHGHSSSLQRVLHTTITQPTTASFDNRGERARLVHRPHSHLFFLFTIWATNNTLRWPSGPILGSSKELWVCYANPLFYGKLCEYTIPSY